ncbi:MAG: hypothetical protein HOI95_04425 [Chromatiales bacterium]|nr:hypothetical protein [Chromatiales bacterium]
MRIAALDLTALNDFGQNIFFALPASAMAGVLRGGELESLQLLLKAGALAGVQDRDGRGLRQYLSDDQFQQLADVLGPALKTESADSVPNVTLYPSGSGTVVLARSPNGELSPPILADFLDDEQGLSALPTLAS